jgi:hypothetical protein
MPRAWEGYNGVVATYFTRTQQNHYVFKLGYVIAQVDGNARVIRLETLMKILTFHQGNKFVPISLVSMMLVAEKEPVKWATWFSQKL